MVVSDLSMMGESVMTNPYGDIELDARGMRVLAHPVRLRALNELQLMAAAL